jgi:hypothetical protein
MNITNWFTGVVEDINDPLQMGRVRVRCFNYHTPSKFDLPTEDLPWSTCILPVTSAAMNGIGETPIGLLPGSWVFGFFRDAGELQDAVVVGSIPSFSTPGDPTQGFSDPHGVFPSAFGSDIPAGATTYGYGSNEAYLGQSNEISNFNSVATGRPGYASTLQGPQVPIQVNGNVGSLISVARGEVGVRETSKNQGPGIAKYWAATSYRSGYNERQPWCAAFVCWCIQQSGLFSEQDRPKTAAAYRGGGFEAWARSKYPAAVLSMRPTQIRAGDLVIYSFSHIGIASTNSDISGNFRCIEGNTNAQGSREGNGVWEKSRNMSSVRSAVTISPSASGSSAPSVLA